MHWMVLRCSIGVQCVGWCWGSVLGCSALDDVGVQYRGVVHWMVLRRSIGVQSTGWCWGAVLGHSVFDGVGVQCIY